MRYFMINPYKDIPKYAEVKMIGHCYDSGYSCFEVEYKGRTYKPFEQDVESEKSIIESFVNFHKQFEESRKIYNQTVCKK